jgi:hypothetical protein
MSAAPTLDPGTLVRVEITDIDLLERTLACSYRETIGKVQDETEDDGQKA